ncbi:MAG: helix-turn-helix domain-containing protein [Chloroflexi bacterium]|nr:helix-turn-helix domain-containing protein [Chloroflexota bacterium]
MIERRDNSDRMMTLQEVARILSVHPNTVRRLVGAGSLSAYRISVRGDLRFKSEDVLHYLDRNRVNGVHSLNQKSTANPILQSQSYHDGLIDPFPVAALQGDQPTSTL